MSDSVPFVSVVLPVFNEEQYLEQCLIALRKVQYPEDKFEIIVVDNGSSDRSYAIAEQYADQLILHPKVNVGAVRNYGVQHAKGDVIAFLDSDCLVPKTWLENGVQLLKQNPKCVFGGNLYLRADPSWTEKYWILQKPDEPLLQSDLLGSCIFVPKQYFQDVGGFNEEVTSGEDTEFSNKLKATGYKVTIDEKLGVVHLGNPTTVSGFVKRQIWHSENYAKSIGSSLTDKVFWLVIIYILGLLALLSSIFGAPISPLYIALALMLPPIVLSIKRITRANYSITGVADIIGIFLMDNLYLLGRSAGFIKGIFGRAKS
ncbi:MAG: glycosyltransferase [Pseudomonadales bacterium]